MENIKLPTWADRTLRLFSGTELVAEKRKGQEWKIKVDRCNNCGLCCIEMECEHHNPILKRCELAIDRPFRCCITRGKPEYCKVRFA